MPPGATTGSTAGRWDGRSGHGPTESYPPEAADTTPPTTSRPSFTTASSGTYQVIVTGRDNTKVPVVVGVGYREVPGEVRG